MEILSPKIRAKKTAPIKIIQFGEGNFLRAFIDWMIQKMNDSGRYHGHVAVVQPLPQGRVDELLKQGGLYTLILQGLKDGEAQRSAEIIDVIDDGVNPYADYGRFLAYARLETLETVISNTTEAGIAYLEADTKIDLTTTCPSSFPGKLLALMKARYERYGKTKPLAVIPLELIDDNGDHLRAVVTRLARERGEEEGLIDYVSNVCRYTSTLVDRIVPGFPRDEFSKLSAELGYIDNNLVKAEIFDLFVLRDEEFVRQRFPVDGCGLEAYYVPDVHPYKKRKVRVLNGSHTALVPVAYLSGFDEVRESLLDPLINRYLTELVSLEVVPTIEVPGIEKFAADVFARFLNPFVHHRLMSIALNSFSKFRERDLPTLLDNIQSGRPSPRLLFALSSLILFYRGLRVKDGQEEPIGLSDAPDVIEFMTEVWKEYETDRDPVRVVSAVLSNVSFWGQDLFALESVAAPVAAYLKDQLEKGTYEALKGVLSDAENSLD